MAVFYPTPKKKSLLALCNRILCDELTQDKCFFWIWNLALWNLGWFTTTEIINTVSENLLVHLQERKMELQQAIVKMEQGGSSDGILQVELNPWNNVKALCELVFYWRSATSLGSCWSHTVRSWGVIQGSSWTMQETWDWSEICGNDWASLW